MLAYRRKQRCLIRAEWSREDLQEGVWETVEHLACTVRHAAPSLRRTRPCTRRGRRRRTGPPGEREGAPPRLGVSTIPGTALRSRTDIWE